MRIETDKKQLWDRLEWARRVSPQSTTLVIGTDVEELVIQIGEAPELHQAKALADVIEDGAVILEVKDAREVGDLKGSTIQIETTDDSIKFSTEEGSLTVPCERTALRRLPQSIKRLGKVDIKALRAAMPPLKDCVAKKSEKGSEGLLEASVRVSSDAMSILATNRLTAWSTVLPLTEGDEDADLVAEFVVTSWAGAITILEDSAYIVHTGNFYGVEDSNTLSLFPISTANDSDKINTIFAQMREEFLDSQPLVFEKIKFRTSLEAIKKNQSYAKVTFKDDGKANIETFFLEEAPEKPRAISFSVDYEGESSIESLIISPINLLKTLKGIQGKKFSLYLPSDKKFPVGVFEAEGRNVAKDSLGLAMTVLQRG